MGSRRSWTDEQLTTAVAESFSYRAVLIRLNLIPAGGNYAQIKQRITVLSLNSEHFKGQGWNAGTKYHTFSRASLDELLTVSSNVQSYKLKLRLYESGLKDPICEICGWCQKAVDGRIPVELDHINGVHSDNRLENLRVLCPNCHSLQRTHRGKNKGLTKRASGGMVYTRHLKCRAHKA